MACNPRNGASTAALPYMAGLPALSAVSATCDVCVYGGLHRGGGTVSGARGGDACDRGANDVLGSSNAMLKAPDLLAGNCLEA